MNTRGAVQSQYGQWLRATANTMIANGEKRTGVRGDKNQTQIPAIEEWQQSRAFLASSKDIINQEEVSLNNFLKLQEDNSCHTELAINIGNLNTQQEYNRQEANLSNKERIIATESSNTEKLQMEGNSNFKSQNDQACSLITEAQMALLRQ